MTSGRIALLDSGGRLSRLANWLGKSAELHQDPYAAIEALAPDPPAVAVVALPQADLEDLCRALRKLLGDSKLLLCCGPAGEPDARRLRWLIDDYFLCPATPGDAERLRKLAQAPSFAASALSPAETSTLVRASATVAQLESAVAQLVAARTGLAVRWAGADQANQQHVLLQAGGGNPRVLIADQGASAQAPGTGLLGALAVVLPALMESARRTESLHRLAITDSLTGAYNRRYFYHVTDRILRRAQAQGFTATLLLYDIDDFKHYNETYGYSAGDEVLREIARLIKQITRSHDIVARTGGEEFAVLFWDPEGRRRDGSLPPETPLVLADRFRQAVRSHRFPSLGGESRGHLTVSGGLAHFPRDGQTCQELLLHAERGLKAAKRSGKDSMLLANADVTTGPAGRSPHTGRRKNGD